MRETDTAESGRHLFPPRAGRAPEQPRRHNFLWTRPSEKDSGPHPGPLTYPAAPADQHRCVEPIAQDKQAWGRTSSAISRV